MDYNFWDDRTIELYEGEGIHPCQGCHDFLDGECMSHGACAVNNKEKLVEENSQ